MDEGIEERIELGLPPKAEYVGVARIVTASFARHHDFGEEQVDDLKVAVSEAVTNAIRAHARDGLDDPVGLKAWMSDGVMTVEVTDRGSGFEPPPAGELGKTPVPGSLEGGLGLTVIRSLFSETTLDRVPAGGMRLRIAVKREAELFAPHR